MKKLKSIKIEDNKVDVKYNIESDSKKTVVEQDLLFTKTHEGWVAQMSMLNMRPKKTMQESASKIADWLIRLGEEIKNQKFGSEDLESIELKRGDFRDRFKKRN